MEATRRAGHSRLVYNKATRTIDTVRDDILGWNINLYFQLVAVIAAGVVAAIVAAFVAGAWLF